MNWKRRSPRESRSSTTSPRPPRRRVPSGLILTCVRTQLGAPGADGRRAFSTIEGSEFDIDCGLVIAAVGQKAVSLELARHGLMDGDRIFTRDSDMGTRLDKVFAAGDAAFGSSTLVQAMFQGHKAAYYVLAALEGERHPAPYRTPYRTRAVAVAQDPAWEKLPLQEPKFLGIGQGKSGDEKFGDAEAGFTDVEARQQAARCYRCDTETGSADYSVKTREAIFAMARVDAKPADFVRLTRERLTHRPSPEIPGLATFDELVFLPANLTRLVIDPYREACKAATDLGPGLDLAQPLLVAGFERAPESVRAAVAEAVAVSGSAHVGREPLPHSSAPWLQIIDAPDAGRPEAAALLLRIGATAPEAMPVAARPGQLRGLIVTSATLERLLPFAVAQKVDLLLLDGSGHFGGSWADLAGAPDLSLLTRAVTNFARAKGRGILSDPVVRRLAVGQRSRQGDRAWRRRGHCRCGGGSGARRRHRDRRGGVPGNRRPGGTAVGLSQGGGVGMLDDGALHRQDQCP